MALIKCSECGKEISSKASACPYCGCPIQNIDADVQNKEKTAAISAEPVAEPYREEKKKKKPKKVVAVVLVILILAMGICGGVKLYNQSRFEKCAYATVTALKEILKNPDSLSVYDVEFYVSNVETGEEERNTITDQAHPIVIMHYTAQNGYGGNTTGYVIATYHKDSKRYEIDGYTYTLTMSEISKYDKDAEWQMMTIYLIKSCRKNNEKIGDIDIKKLNRKIKREL